MENKKKIILLGSNGRMGKTIKEVINDNEAIKNQLEIIKIDTYGDVDFTTLNSVKEKIDLIIDFSTPKASLLALEYAKKNRIAFISGTTGFTPMEFDSFEEAAKDIKVFYASNYSVGINILKKLLKQAVELAANDYDIEMVEMHHNQKEDAPSGTALSLKQTMLEAGDFSEDNVIYGRKGIIGKRPKKEIAIHTLRGGEVFGDHSILFAGNNEILELKHRAVSRKAFASGVLKAVKFLLNQKSAGMYSIDDLF